jgi:predicted DNA-binding antitoxin AbrB/MazE fold protein
LQTLPIIITVDGQSRQATEALVQEFGKVKGTQFNFGEAIFTIEDRGRISIKETDYNIVKETLNLIPLSSNLTYSTYSPVYQNTGEELFQVASDFSPTAPISYSPDANYEVSEGENVELEVRFDDPYNASLIEELRKSGKKISKELAERVEKSLVIFTTLKGDQISGSLKETHSTIGEEVTDNKFLEVRKNAYLAVLENLKNGSTGFKLNSKVQVKNIVLGFPNMNAQQTEQGYEPLNVDFTEENLGVVVNTGYVLNGKSFLSKDEKGVRFDFTTKLSKKNKTTKIPVIVFEYKGVKYHII